MANRHPKARQISTAEALSDRNAICGVVNLLGGHHGLGGNHATWQDGSARLWRVAPDRFRHERRERRQNTAWARGSRATRTFSAACSPPAGVLFSHRRLSLQRQRRHDDLRRPHRGSTSIRTTPPTLFALSYVTPWKILGGTYAVAVVPSVVAMDVDVASGNSRDSPVHAAGSFGPFDINAATPNLPRATRPSPRSSSAGMPAIFHWNVGVFGFAPTGEYEQQASRQYEPEPLGDHAAARRERGSIPRTGGRSTVPRSIRSIGRTRQPITRPATSSISTAPSPRISDRSASAWSAMP